MIEWLTRTQLDARLATYPPIGLRLRSMFHARTRVEPDRWFSRSPEEVNEPELGTMLVWSGLIDRAPFAIVASSRRTGWGFEVRLPQRSDGDGAWATVIRALGLPAWTHPYFESVLTERGFGVVAIADTNTPIYRGAKRDDAAAIAALLNDVERASYTTVPVSGAEPSWLVIGPDAGPYVSRIEFTPDERTALTLAARWTVETGASFRVARMLRE